MVNNTSQEPELVRDLMTLGVVTCSTNTPVTTIAEAILEKDIEAVVVLDKEGHALGIVGQNELAATYGRGDYHDLSAEDIMRDGLPTIPPDIPLSAAAQLMRDNGERVYFLMHNSAGIAYPAAFISYKHFIRHIAMKDLDDIKDMGIKAERQAPLETFRKRIEAKKASRSNMHLEK